MKFSELGVGQFFMDVLGYTGVKVEPTKINGSIRNAVLLTSHRAGSFWIYSDDEPITPLSEVRLEESDD